MKELEELSFSEKVKFKLPTFQPKSAREIYLLAIMANERYSKSKDSDDYRKLNELIGKLSNTEDVDYICKFVEYITTDYDKKTPLDKDGVLRKMKVLANGVSSSTDKILKFSQTISGLGYKQGTFAEVYSKLVPTIIDFGDNKSILEFCKLSGGLVSESSIKSLTEYFAKQDRGDLKQFLSFVDNAYMKYLVAGLDSADKFEDLIEIIQYSSQNQLARIGKWLLDQNNNKGLKVGENPKIELLFNIAEKVSDEKLAGLLSGVYLHPYVKDMYNQISKFDGGKSMHTASRLFAMGADVANIYGFMTRYKDADVKYMTQLMGKYWKPYYRHTDAMKIHSIATTFLGVDIKSLSHAIARTTYGANDEVKEVRMVDKDMVNMEICELLYRYAVHYEGADIKEISRGIAKTSNDLYIYEFARRFKDKTDLPLLTKNLAEAEKCELYFLKEYVNAVSNYTDTTPIQKRISEQIKANQETSNKTDNSSSKNSELQQ